jgi:polyhydroxybutyrate depolymerase
MAMQSIRQITTAMASLIAVTNAATALADAPDPDALRRAEAFARLVRDEQPDIRPPAERASLAATGSIDAGRGPILVHVPASYDPATPTSLVILLHGYSNTGQDVEDWMQFASLVDEYEFLYLYPTGTSDFLGNPFWNATDACCDLFGSGVDDSAYLRNVIEQMQLNYNVDPDSIHFTGHSNGGFMSYRMACDHADLVASIASLAGATFLDPADCTPVLPVHTLQIHGTADTVIPYNGGCVPFGGCHPGAVETTEQWAAYDGCSLVGEPQPDPLDIDAGIPGSETNVIRYADACAPGGSAELWTVNGGPHSPNLSTDYNRLVIEFLLDHSQPANCPADINGDNVVGINDFLDLLAAWGPNPGHPADLDGDDVVGVTDFLVLLAHWGACP